MTKLTKKEQAWVKRVQKALDDCPSKDKIGFYTVGDNDVKLYDLRLHEEVTDFQNDNRHADFCNACDELNAHLDESLFFPSPVESTAG